MYHKFAKNRELNKVIETKQQTSQVIEQINKFEKQEGREIDEIKVREVQISNDLLLKEHLLKGNEFYYKKRIRGLLDNLRKYKQAVECYDKALEIDPNDVDALNNKGIVSTTPDLYDGPESI